ncbi:sodium-dependent dopamine transporter-like isoform X2 [Trichoplusia ni]|uniref:Sodium-dependent dopamine transporter-like isoform X2 n=1 Tax=Trichoplusia ni TaxID=7111 RepID=A0A7E5W4J5_TRINI|nr:sodium-dependent dopamine transporter-like isoform X2 [Trichoplusia ni]
MRLIDFIFVESTVGLSYLCMDSFIKQFTRRYDCYRFMSPLLRGISYGRFLQSAYYLLLNVSYVVDCLRFMIGSFREVPPWSMCAPNSSCLSPEDVMYLCNNNKTIKFSKTSAGKYYQEAFSTMDRNALTTRLFMTGVVWMLIFFIASVAEDTIIKIFKLTFVVRAVSTLITMVFLLISVEDHASQAFSIILDISGPSTLMLAARHTCYAYGIGLLGPYDFGLMSPYTMIDTAAVISVAMFTLLAFLRSWIVKTLVLVMTECIILQPQDLKTHILFYAILPFSAEFLHAHKLYVFYLYGNMLMGTLIFVTNLVLLLSKFLSYEFRSVKQIYIVGLLCCLGLALSVPLLIMMSNLSQKKVLTFGIDMMATYLGGLFVAIVMWLYGLGRFATDIQYWLAFRPTRFWTISWALLPVALFAMTIASFVEILTLEDPMAKWTALGWVAFTLLLVGIMNLKVMVGFLMRNNLAGLFKANKHYGPPDSEDRKRRLYYSEFTRQRKCRHNCLVIDDWFDCNHKTITLDNKTTLSSSSSEDGSLLNIYDSKTASRLRSIGALSPAIQIQT